MNREINSVLAISIVALFSFATGVFVVTNVRSLAQVNFLNLSQTVFAINNDNTNAPPVAACVADKPTPEPGDPGPGKAGQPGVTFKDNSSQWHGSNPYFQWTGDAKLACTPAAGVPKMNGNGDYVVPDCGPITAPRSHSNFEKTLVLTNDVIVKISGKLKKTRPSSTAHCDVFPSTISVTCDGDANVAVGETATVTWTITDTYAPDTVKYLWWVDKDPKGDKTWDVDKAQPQNCKTATQFYVYGNTAGSNGVKTMSCNFTPTKARTYTLVANATASDGHNLVTNKAPCNIIATQPLPTTTPTPLPPIRH